MKGVMVRLAGSLLGVFAFWVAIWQPLVLSETSAAEPQEQILGDPEAPVTIIEYASLTCPHCAQFHNEVLPELKKKYIAPGKVRLVYRDFPLDIVAWAAAGIAHCFGSDRYFPSLEVLFRNQQRWARANDRAKAVETLEKLGLPQQWAAQDFEAENIKAFMEAAAPIVAAMKQMSTFGLPMEQAAECLANPELMDGILRTRLDAENEYQVDSTPTLVINGEVYSGPRDVESLSQVIDPLIENS